METAIEMEKKISKVRKLLALATSNVEAESMAAMMKAQELMSQYGITSSDIEADNGDKKNQEGVTETEIKRARFRWWMTQLALVVAKNTACYVYLGNNGTLMKFLGRESNSMLAKEIYAYAYKVMKYGMSSRGYTKAAQKNDYANGFLMALKKKFQENVSSKALVIVPDGEVVNAMDKLNCTQKKAGKITSGGDFEAFANGMDDGKNFDKDRKQIEK